MAVTKVSRSVIAAADTSSADPHAITTPAQSHTAGNLLVVGISAQYTSVSSVTNTAGDTFSKTTSSPSVPTAANYESIWYTLSTAGNASDVITANLSGKVGGGGTYNTICCYEFNTSSGTWTFGADSVGTAASGTAITTGSITLSTSGVIVANFESDGGNTPTPAAGYTLSNQDGGSGFTWDMYHITSASEAAAATGAAGGKWNIIGASFAVSGGGGSRGLFETHPMSGTGVGGSFFRNPLHAPMQMARRDRIFVPERYAA